MAYSQLMCSCTEHIRLGIIFVRSFINWVFAVLSQLCGLFWLWFWLWSLNNKQPRFTSVLYIHKKITYTNIFKINSNLLISPLWAHTISFTLFRRPLSIEKFRWRRLGSLLLGLRTLDPPLGLLSTPADIFFWSDYSLQEQNMMALLFPTLL